MKRFGIIFIAACLLLTSCGKGVKDIALTSFRLLSVSPQGLNGVTLLVEVGVDNPTVGFEITDVNAVLKLDGKLLPMPQTPPMKPQNLLPMMLMLMIIFAIVMIPAWLAF